MFTPSQILCCLDDLMVEGYFLVLFVFVSCFFGRLFAVLAEDCIQVNWVMGNILICLFLTATAVPVCATDSQTVRQHWVKDFLRRKTLPKNLSRGDIRGSRREHSGYVTPH